MGSARETSFEIPCGVGLTLAAVPFFASLRLLPAQVVTSYWGSGSVSKNTDIQSEPMPKRRHAPLRSAPTAVPQLKYRSVESKEKR